MRSAKIRDHWRKLVERNHDAAPIIREVKFRDLAGFKDDCFQTANGFACICGGTGHGKTALLELMARALTASDDSSRKCSSRVLQATVEMKIAFGSNINDVSGEGGKHAGSVKFIDLNERTFFLLDYFRKFNLDVLREGITPTRLSADVVEVASAACGKKYTDIIVYEIEGEDDKIVPYFEIKVQGTEYNSLDMATGELSVIYLSWALNRSDRGDVILIEEPEAYLPPVSHKNIIAMIVSAADRRGLSIVFSTHSSLVVDEVPEPNILPLRQEAGKSVIARGPKAKLKALQRLGLIPPRKVIFVVEDRCAKLVLRHILASAGTNFWADYEIAVESRGESAIREFVRRIPQDIKSSAIIGVLDGDQEIAGPDLLKLPMDGAPEMQLLIAITNNLAKFATMIGRGLEIVEDAMNEVSHLDIHDAFPELARKLSVSDEVIIVTAAELWLKTTGNKTKVNGFIGLLNGAIEPRN